ncbi:enoyl-CoA hydratase [Amaricoccus tamworthensis]|uniref:enoyl-CoA hydratase n=1 Tax=Amaricoccus tamworthensis TaxID=57002 RepID=UPI003C7D1B79
MEGDILLREDAGAVATLTLKNPGKLNALSNGMLDALQAQLDALAGDRSIRVVVIRGEGRAFCAGHDLREMTAAREADDGGQAEFEALFDKCSKMMMSIVNLPQPVIAQVHGIAAAAGCQLVATCDLAVAASDARFGVNGVNIGLFCSTPMVALTRNIGRKKAFELLTTGDFLTAEQAENVGLINHAAPPEKLKNTTRDLAEKIAGKLGPAVRIGKRAFYEQAEMTMAEAYAHTGKVIAANMMRPDTAKGIEAFLDKRTPEWDQ